MNNCLRKKEIPPTAGDAFLNLALVMVPLGIALGVAWGAIELMPQLTLLNLITGIPLLAGYAGIRILQGIIPWLFFYFLLCRICDRLAAGGIPLSLLRWVMLLGAAGVGTVCTGYCNGLWMEYAGVSKLSLLCSSRCCLLSPKSSRSNHRKHNTLCLSRCLG